MEDVNAMLDGGSKMQLFDDEVLKVVSGRRG